jgi:hypothetical protein
VAVPVAEVVRRAFLAVRRMRRPQVPAPARQRHRLPHLRLRLPQDKSQHRVQSPRRRPVGLERRWPRRKAVRRVRRAADEALVAADVAAVSHRTRPRIG